MPGKLKPKSFWEFSCLYFQSCHRRAGIKDMCCPIWLYLGSGELNSGPPGWEASTLPIEPYPQCLVEFYQQNVLRYSTDVEPQRFIPALPLFIIFSNCRKANLSPLFLLSPYLFLAAPQQPDYNTAVSVHSFNPLSSWKMF